MSLLMHVENEFYVELKQDSHEVYQLCRNNSAKKLNGKTYLIPKKNILGFYESFSLLTTETTKDAKFQMNKYLEDNNDIVETRYRFPNDMYVIPPYEIQRIAINKMINLNVFGLFLQMGLGKTKCAVDTFRFHYKKGTAKSLLIICPSAVLYTWRTEILKNSTEFVEGDILICNTGVTEHRRCFDINKKIYIMTYDTWKIIITEYCDKTAKAKRKIVKLKDKRKSFLDRGFKKEDEQVLTLQSKIASSKHKCTCRTSTLAEILKDKKIMFVADEAHKIGNRTSSQTYLTMREKSNFVYKYILSGTPIRKSPLELWALTRVLSNFLIRKTYPDFENSLVKKGGYNNHGVLYYKRGVLQKLLDTTLGKYFLREFSDNWLDLPKQTITYLQYDLKQSAFYDVYQNYANNLLNNLEGLKEIKYKDVKPYMLQVLRFLSSPREDNPRWKILDDQLDTLIDNQDNDVIVWSYQPEVLEFLFKRYKKYNPVVVHGQNPKSDKNKIKERENRKDTFINNKKCKLALFSSLVMDTGITVLNCTSMVCVDINMSTIHHFQLEKRNHRIGQKFRTNVFYLECLNEMDELASYILERDRHTDTNLFDKPDSVLIAKMNEILKIRDTLIIS